MAEEKNSMRIRSSDDGGYILAVLLIGMAIAAVWLSASLPAWRQQAQREKEADLIFRGEQYARAIALFYVKNNTLPPDIDTLVSQHFLRKKWKDPITNDDFDLILAGQQQGSQQNNGNNNGSRGPGSAPPPTSNANGLQSGNSNTNRPGSPLGGQTLGAGGIQGVASKSKATSIKIYAPQGGMAAASQEYDLWVFNYTSACVKMVGNPSCRRQQQGNGPQGPNGPNGPRGPNGPGNNNGLNPGNRNNGANPLQGPQGPQPAGPRRAGGTGGGGGGGGF